MPAGEPRQPVLRRRSSCHVTRHRADLRGASGLPVSGAGAEAEPDWKKRLQRRREYDVGRVRRAASVAMPVFSSRYSVLAQLRAAVGRAETPRASRLTPGVRRASRACRLSSDARGVFRSDRAARRELGKSAVSRREDRHRDARPRARTRPTSYSRRRLYRFSNQARLPHLPPDTAQTRSRLTSPPMGASHGTRSSARVPGCRGSPGRISLAVRTGANAQARLPDR